MILGLIRGVTTLQTNKRIKNQSQAHTYNVTSREINYKIPCTDLSLNYDYHEIICPPQPMSIASILYQLLSVGVKRNFPHSCKPSSMHALGGNDTRNLKKTSYSKKNSTTNMQQIGSLYKLYLFTSYKKISELNTYHIR